MAVGAVAAPPAPYSDPFKHIARQASSQNASGLQVDLGYETYQGYHNDTSGLDIWKGYVLRILTLATKLSLTNNTESASQRHP